MTTFCKVSYLKKRKRRIFLMIQIIYKYKEEKNKKTRAYVAMCFFFRVLFFSSCLNFCCRLVVVRICHGKKPSVFFFYLYKNVWHINWCFLAYREQHYFKCWWKHFSNVQYTRWSRLSTAYWSGCKSISCSTSFRRHSDYTINATYVWFNSSSN
jgi:hypothetical protein